MYQSASACFGTVAALLFHFSGFGYREVVFDDTAVLTSFYNFRIVNCFWDLEK
ncbi:hypothetical protein HN51_059037, partial [Arachis hypogaea]